MIAKHPPLDRWDDTARTWTPMRDRIEPGSGFIACADVPADDVTSNHIDQSWAVVMICMLDLPGETKDALNARLPWRLRDARAPRFPDIR